MFDATFLYSESLEVFEYILYDSAFSALFQDKVIEPSLAVALTKSGLFGAFLGKGVADTIADFSPSQSPDIADILK